MAHTTQQTLDENDISNMSNADVRDYASKLQRKMRMNSIYETPWGATIDLSKVVAVEMGKQLTPNYIIYPTLMIYFIDTDETVSTQLYNTSQSYSELEIDLCEIKDKVVSAWKEYKGES